MGFFFLDFRDGPAYNSGIEADEEFERDRGGLNDLPGRRRGMKNSQAKGSDFDAPWKAAMHRRSKAGFPAESFR